MIRIAPLLLLSALAIGVAIVLSAHALLPNVSAEPLPECETKAREDGQQEGANCYLERARKGADPGVRVQWLRRSGELFEEAERFDLAIVSYELGGNIASQNRLFLEAQFLYERVVELEQDELGDYGLGDLENAGRFYRLASLAAAGKGDYSLAIRFMSSGGEMFRLAGNPHEAARAYQRAARLSREFGRFDFADSLMQTAAGIYDELGGGDAARVSISRRIRTELLDIRRRLAEENQDLPSLIESLLPGYIAADLGSEVSRDSTPGGLKNSDDSSEGVELYLEIRANVWDYLVANRLAVDDPELIDRVTWGVLEDLRTQVGAVVWPRFVDAKLEEGYWRHFRGEMEAVRDNLFDDAVYEALQRGERFEFGAEPESLKRYKELRQQGLDPVGGWSRLKTEVREPLANLARNRMVALWPGEIVTASSAGLARGRQDKRFAEMARLYVAERGAGMTPELLWGLLRRGRLPGLKMGESLLEEGVGNLMARAGIQPEIREGILFGRLEVVYQRYLSEGR